MRKEWLLAIATTLLSLIVGLLAIRWLAPQLFGVPVDLRLVPVDDAKVPLHELLFTQEGIGQNAFSVSDPYTVLRGGALLGSSNERGPHDLAGFRNSSIPNVADVVVLGDSQTYGLGVTMQDSWPQQLGIGTVYSMAFGGWSAPQYLYMLGHAMRLRPRVVVVAFYVGNDPVESYAQVYGNPRLAEFRHPSGVVPEAPPPVQFPAPKEDQWRVDLPGDRWLHFTPKGRRINVALHPAADDGWRILGAMATQMVTLVRENAVQIRFTVIPTREFAYAPLLQSLGIEPPSDFAGLVDDESRRIQEFAAMIEGIAPGSYLDVTEALRQAILRGEFVYPNGVDGHPARAGHAAIAAALRENVRSLVPPPPCGRFRLSGPAGEAGGPGIADGTGYWLGDAAAAAESIDLPTLSERDLAGLQQHSAPTDLQTGPCQRGT